MVHAKRSSLNRTAFLAGLGTAALLARPGATLAQSAPVRLGAAGSETFDEAFFIVDGGFLTKAGMTGEATLLPNGGRIIEAVLGNSLDIGMSDTSQLANAFNHGLPLAFFAGGGLYDTNAPTTVLTVPKNSPLKDPKELEGKTIALQGLKTLAEISTREWLHSHGADPAKVSFIEMAPTAIVPGLLRGTYAAAIVSEPGITQNSGEIRIFGKPYDNVAKRFYISSLYAKRDYLANGMAKKLQDIVYATATWANANQDKSGAILATRLKQDPELIKRMNRCTFATSLDPKLMQPVLDIAVKYGLIEKPVDAASLIFK